MLLGFLAFVPYKSNYINKNLMRFKAIKTYTPAKTNCSAASIQLKKPHLLHITQYAVSILIFYTAYCIIQYIVSFVKTMSIFMIKKNYRKLVLVLISYLPQQKLFQFFYKKCAYKSFKNLSAFGFASCHIDYTQLTVSAYDRLTPEHVFDCFQKLLVPETL